MEEHLLPVVTKHAWSEPEKNLDIPFVLGYVLVGDSIHSKGKDRDGEAMVEGVEHTQ